MRRNHPSESENPNGISASSPGLLGHELPWVIAPKTSFNRNAVAGPITIALPQWLATNPNRIPASRTAASRMKSSAGSMLLAAPFRSRRSRRFFSLSSPKEERVGVRSRDSRHESQNRSSRTPRPKSSPRNEKSKAGRTFAASPKSTDQTSPGWMPLGTLTCQ